MKKRKLLLLSFVSIATMILSMTSCGGKDNPNPDPKPDDHRSTGLSETGKRDEAAADRSLRVSRMGQELALPHEAHLCGLFPRLYDVQGVSGDLPMGRDPDG